MSGTDLPPAVRARVLALASGRLGTLSEDAVPPAVRPFRRFTPAKRARLAGSALAAALESDPVFRQRVAEGVDQVLADAVREGVVLPAAAPEDVAAAAYLLRTEGWHEQLERAAADLRERERAVEGAAGLDTVARLTEQLAAVRTSGRATAEGLRAELAASQAQVAALNKRVRALGAQLAATERRLAGQQLPPASTLAAGPAGPAPVPHEGQDGNSAAVRRLTARLRATEAALASARSAARAERNDDAVRLRVLLDALVGAAAGLRRELALPPAGGRPVDAASAPWTEPASPGSVPRRGRGEDDPQLLDALLAVPAVHLLVDGYNVTLGGYGALPLETQRGRLLSGLGALAARTGAEITVVFDGAAVEGVRVSAPRGVRLLFSRPGETADDVLRALVAAEVPGRPLVVVSSDRAVADDGRRAGATAMQSRALLSLLEH